jgi:hypothetical protein
VTLQAHLAAVYDVLVAYALFAKNELASVRLMLLTVIIAAPRCKDIHLSIAKVPFFFELELDLSVAPRAWTAPLPRQGLLRTLVLALPRRESSRCGRRGRRVFRQTRLPWKVLLSMPDEFVQEPC